MRRNRRIIVTDIHLGRENNNEKNLEVSLVLFKTIADFCVKNNIDNIDILGDFFDDRKEINVLTMHYAEQIAKILNKFNTKIILGNHDAFYKDRPIPNSLSIFKEKYENIKIIDNYVHVENNIAYVPYFHQDYFIEKIDDYRIEYHDIKYVFGHFDINGFQFNSKVISRNNKLNANDFKGFELVLSGHYHVSSNNGIIYYLGSPYQMNFGEVESDHGFWVFDDGKLEFQEFNEYPKYKIIYFGQRSIPLEDIIGNKVKLVFTEEVEQKYITDFIERVNLLKPYKLYTDFTQIKLINDDVIQEIDLSKIDNTEELFEKYLEIVNVPEHLNKKMLIKIFENFLKNGE